MCHLTDPCGGQWLLDREHLSHVATELGLDMEAVCEQARSGTLTMPVIFRCAGSGHTLRMMPERKRRGRYVPLCLQCWDPILEHPQHVGGGGVKYHPACRPLRAHYRRREEPRYVWLEDEGCATMMSPNKPPPTAGSTARPRVRAW